MPIIRMEVVLEEAEELPEKQVLQALADGLGECMHSRPGGTWLMASGVPAAQYVENGGPVPAGIRPVFLTVIRHKIPDEETLTAECRKMAALAGEYLDRPADNIHITFEPEAAGRIAFGGELRT